MDYEKEYERALGTAKMWYRNTAMSNNVKEILNRIFPELEDYSDMRIIKEITFFLKQNGGYNKEWIDWLEKLAPKPQGKSALKNSESKIEIKKINDIHDNPMVTIISSN